MRVGEETAGYVALYRSAFERYGVQALWSVRMLDDPTPADAPSVARSFRIEGDLGARVLAEQIERVCRAAV